MSPRFIQWYLLLPVVFLFPYYASAQLQVDVAAISTVKGEILLAVYDSADTFMDETQAVYSTIAPVTNNTVSVTITTLPPGDYAIALLHDENGNKEMDTNAFGLPKEGYGFSNNARGMMGPPSFDAAKFSLSDTAKTIQIKLR